MTVDKESKRYSIRQRKILSYQNAEIDTLEKILNLKKAQAINLNFEINLIEGILWSRSH